MDNNSLEHVGILGMKWGRRKSRDIPTTQTARKIKGKRFIVDKTRFGETVSKRQVSKKEFDTFMEAKKKQKTIDLFKKQQKWERFAKASSLLVAAYSTVSIASMLAPNLTDRVARTVAWNLGSVISNTPLR